LEIITIEIVKIITNEEIQGQPHPSLTQCLKISIIPQKNIINKITKTIAIPKKTIGRQPNFSILKIKHKTLLKQIANPPITSIIIL
jgi:hypothetical protein